MEVKQLSNVDAAYIAGIIDGEGTITLARKHRSENRQLAISISNTERYLLDYILLVVGAGKITTKRTYKSHHKSSFTYAIYNRQALCLLAQVHLYLRTYKARRSELILENYIELTPRNGKYTDEQRMARKNFENTILRIKPS